MEKVSSLSHLALRGSQYIFLLVGESHQKDGLQKALDASFEAFGDEGGQPIRAVRATRRHRRDIYTELQARRWPKEIKSRIRSERQPFLVIIKSDFRLFDPQDDDWRIVWLGDARAPGNSIPGLLGAFTRAIEYDEDVFAYLDGLSSPGTGLSPYGGVSSPHTLTSAKRNKKVGRPGIFDLEYGATETIDAIVRDWTNSDAEVPRLKHGWRTDFVREMRRTNQSLRDSFGEKSIYDRLMKSKEFENIERRLTRPEN
jgi:hypothetical protein